MGSTVDAGTREAEAKQLKALFEGAGLEQASFARDSEIGTSGVVWQILNAHRPLNLPAATKFAAALGVKIDAFSKRLAEEVRAAAPYVQGLEAAEVPDPLAGKTVHEALQNAESRMALRQALNQVHEPTPRHHTSKSRMTDSNKKTSKGH